MRVLDIGCGWGGAARFAAERYRVSVTGLTVSQNQFETARETCRDLPVEIRFEDYRAHQPAGGHYDRIYSLGMFEHVGERNYHTYFRKARELLAPDGLFLLHTIGTNLATPGTDPWIEKYIFPNSHLPSHAEIAHAAEPWWVIEDWHNFGVDYDRTLLAWSHNISRRWHEIPGYDERFRRMWHYWLMASAASFRARRTQLWQVVLSPMGRLGGYAEVR
jgi:cyclopropane-fatty-acyl-phospholipid synthase